MLFNEALAELVKGKYLQRAAWEASAEYVVLLPGMQYVWKILTQPTPNAGNWLPFVADLQADDWKVVEHLPELPKA